MKNKQVCYWRNKWLILATPVFFSLSYFYLNKIFAIRFVDEEDNLVLGYFLLQGQKLYSDLFSHHQPLAYLISSAFQFFTNPENIYELVKEHREFMIFWSLSWAVLLIWRFKEKVIAPLIIFEVSKFYLLGNLFLSESLAVYPIFYLILFLFEQKSKYKAYEYAILGFLISFSALLLAPVWPFLAAYLFFLIWFKKPSKKQYIYLFSGGLLPALISLPFVDIYYYFRNTFYINFKYYIPQSAEEKMPLSLIKSFISPLTILLNSIKFESSGFILKITLPFFAITLGYLAKTKKFRLLIAVVTLLTLSNLRYYAPGLEYSAGFHLLIWYGIFILISYYFIADLIKNVATEWVNKVLIGLIAIAVLTGCFASQSFFKKNNLMEDYEKNYSKQYIFGEAIKAMKSPQDTLFVIPDEWLLYFQADIKNNNRMVNYYGWMSLVWELNDPVIEKFKTDPPAFFYCDCNEEIVLNYSDDYTQMIRNGAKTPLWVSNGKFTALNEDQKSNLRRLNFQLE